MIIGKGLLARGFAEKFAHRTDITVFASGVSNSQETRAEEFFRERNALAEALDSSSRLVYFGSCGAGGIEDTPYMQHKRSMEALVLSIGDSLVLRLPQVVGPTDNPNTLTNFLYSSIRDGKPFNVWANATRNLIDIEDVVTIGSHLIDRSRDEPRVIAVASRQSLTMPEIVQVFEKIIGRRAEATIVDRGDPLQIDSQRAVEVASGLGIDLGDGYAESIIRKYYGYRCAT